MESAVSYALLHPAGFVNVTGRGSALLAFRRTGQPVFLRGGVGWGGRTIPGSPPIQGQDFPNKFADIS